MNDDIQSKEIFPQANATTIPLSTLYNKFLNLFDEPEKAISSDSKAANNKIDELKKIIDDAAKKIEQENPTPKDHESPSQSLDANATLQGEGSTSASSYNTHVQGENETLDVSIEPPF